MLNIIVWLKSRYMAGIAANNQSLQIMSVDVNYNPWTFWILQTWVKKIDSILAERGETDKQAKFKEKAPGALKYLISKTKELQLWAHSLGTTKSSKIYIQKFKFWQTLPVSLFLLFDHKISRDCWYWLSNNRKSWEHLWNLKIWEALWTFPFCKSQAVWNLYHAQYRDTR